MRIAPAASRRRRASAGREPAAVLIALREGGNRAVREATFRADDGTRTHDLLHGKGWRAFAPVRARSPKRLVCSDFGRSE
jgi:hypothetical protein